MRPKEGWSDFKESEIISDLIWNILQTRDTGGMWEYYNFTSDTSIWSQSIYSLILQCEKEDCNKIQSIQFINPKFGNVELNQLMTILEERYGFITY